jgi:tetratricopeptide (TPR) repeat protein
VGSLRPFHQMREAARARDMDAVVQLGEPCLRGLEAERRFHAVLPDAHAIYANALNEKERLPEAIAHFEVALYGPDNQELSFYRRSALVVTLANAYWRVGRYQDLVNAVAPVLAGQGTPAQQATALRMLSSITWRTTGDLDAATRLLEQSATAAGQRSGMWWRDAVYRGQYLMELGRLPEAEAVLRHGVDRERDELRAHPNPDRPMVANLAIFLGALARVEVRLGRIEVAEEMHAESAALLPPDRHFGRYTWHLLAAEIAAARQDHPLAAEHADTCLDITTRLGARPSMAVSWKLQGRVARDRDQVPYAIDRFRLARAGYVVLGHPRDTAEMEAELAALGVGP